MIRPTHATTTRASASAPSVSDSLREAAEHFQVHIAAARTDASDGTRIGAIDTVDVTILDDDDS